MHSFQYEEEFDQMYCCKRGSEKGDIQTTKLKTFLLHMNQLAPRVAHSFAQTSVISIGSYDLPCYVLTLASLPGIPKFKSVYLTNLQENLFSEQEIKTGIMQECWNVSTLAEIWKMNVGSKPFPQLSK